MNIQQIKESLKTMYKERLVISEKKWPPVRGHQLINLQLVEIEKHEGFQGQEKDKKSKKKIKSIRISPNDIFSAKKGKLPIRKVLVEGSAGVGKTTLCTILTEGWAKGNLLAQFDLVLFLPLRDRRVSSAESLSDLLKIVCVSEAQCSIAVDFIKKNFGKDVLIIADGWDELENRKRSEYSFLYQLFTGQYLRLVSVLLTSRPSVSADLHDVSTLHRVVEVVGFDEECVKEYIKSEFEEHPEKASTLIDQLEDNPIVQSVCSVPLNCAILCNLWHSLNQELPKTLTELYTQLVLNIIFRNIKKATTNTEQNIGLSLNSFESIPSPLDLEFWRTCEFAYDCLLHDKIVFSDADLISLFPEGMRLSNDFLCFGLLQLAKSPYLIGHALSFHFLHLTIQEFLAALHFSTVSSAEKLELCKDQARNSHLNMFWRFVFGLGCRKCQSKANTSASRRFCSCDDALVDLFISEAKTTLSEKIQFSICFGDQRLLLCHCAFESKDRTISTKIAQEMSCMFKITTYTPFDSLAVCHVLSYSSESKVDIGMSNCGLGDKHLEELTSVLSSKDDKMKVKDLHLENNNLTEVSIYNLFKYGVKSLESLENLYLQNNKLQNIVGVFNHSFLIWLKKLSLSDNPLGEMGISSLASALDGSFGVLASLSELELCNTFTDDAKINAKVLAKLLASLSSGYHIFSLDLSCNNFGVPGACELGKALPKLSKFLGITLILKETNLTCEAMICFSTNALEQFSLTSSVTSSTLFLVATSTLHISVPNVSLILSHNPLGYGGLVAAFRLLKQEKCYIQSLKLRKTGITCPSSTYDGPRLKHLVCDNGSAPLHSLSLRGNDLSGEGISILVDCLQICKQLEFLSTEKCSITSTDTLKFCSLLRELKMSCTNLKTWNLCKNSISDDGIYSLIENLPELFPNLSQVYVVDNHMLSTEMKSFLNRTLLGDNESYVEVISRAASSSSEVMSILEQDPESAAGISLIEAIISAGQMETPSSSDLETSDESDSQSLDDYNPEYEDSPQEACEEATLITPSESSTTVTDKNTSMEVKPSLCESAGKTPLTVEVLKEKIGLEDSDLDKLIVQTDFPSVAKHFDEVEIYMYQFDLTSAEQADITNQRNTQAAIMMILKYWTKRNPYKATFRALVQKLLMLEKGNVAAAVCEYIKEEKEINYQAVATCSL